MRDLPGRAWRGTGTRSDYPHGRARRREFVRLVSGFACNSKEDLQGSDFSYPKTYRSCSRGTDFPFGFACHERHEIGVLRFHRNSSRWRGLDCRGCALDDIHTLHRYRRADYCCRVHQFRERATRSIAGS